MVFSFFKSRRPKAYHVEPRYYDERGENLKKRIAQIKAELANDALSEDEKIQRSYKEAWQKKKNYHAGKKQSNLRLIIIAGVLFILAYYLLFSA